MFAAYPALAGERRSPRETGGAELAEEISAEGKHRLAAQNAGKLYRSDQRCHAGGQISCDYFCDAEIHDMTFLNL